MLVTISISMIVIGYLMGSFPSAVLTCKLLNLPDPRSQGSGNPGATNVLRIGGKKAAIITLLLDVLKGVLPVLIARCLHLSPFYLSLVAFAAFIGHLFPVFLKFKGGKGVATSFGALIALNAYLGLCLIFTWIIVALIFRYSSLAALITAILAPVYTLFLLGFPTVYIIVMMSIMLIIKHHKNIRQLWMGIEGKIGRA